jgi:hypothetical protein
LLPLIYLQSSCLNDSEGWSAEEQRSGQGTVGKDWYV